MSAPKSPNAANQVDTIKALVSRVEVVTVAGQDIALQVPSLEDARRIRAESVKLAEATDGDKETEAQAGLQMAATCVGACIPDISVELAEKLVVASGGEFGDLAAKAMDLCGISKLVDRAMERGDADPTT